MAENDIHARALELARSGKYKGVRITGTTIEVKPRPPGKQQWQPLGTSEPEPPRAA